MRKAIKNPVYTAQKYDPDNFYRVNDRSDRFNPDREVDCDPDQDLPCKQLQDRNINPIARMRYAFVFADR